MRVWHRFTTGNGSLMTSAPSLLSLTAAGLYAVVTLICVAAAYAARANRQLDRHVMAWIVLAVLFAGLVAARYYGIEDALRQDLRMMLRDATAYDERRSLQRPIAAALVIVAGAAIMAWLYSGLRHVRGRRDAAVAAAMIAATAMIGLVALRLVSLSPVDGLLYGPLKLNWVIDIGAALGVIGAAGVYIRVVTGPRR
jgi:MFS family permease